MFWFLKGGHDGLRGEEKCESEKEEEEGEREREIGLKRERKWEPVADK